MLDLLRSDDDVPERAARAALRRAERPRRAVPAGAARGSRIAGACSARARVLMGTSYGNRTSPVLRGAWILENITGTPPTLAAAGRRAVQGDRAGQEGRRPCASASKRIARTRRATAAMA